MNREKRRRPKPPVSGALWHHPPPPWKKRKKAETALAFTLLQFPDELLVAIAMEIDDPRDLATLTLTCSRLNAIVATDVSIWERHARKWGYAKGTTIGDLNAIQKSYIVLWSVKQSTPEESKRSIPIVGIVHNVRKPATLRNSPLTAKIFQDYKRRLEAITTTFNPNKEKLDTPLPWGHFGTMTSLGDEKVLKLARIQWVIGPLGFKFSHLQILEYALHHCFSVIKSQDIEVAVTPEGTNPTILKNRLLLAFELGMCGLALTAVHMELKERACYAGHHASPGLNGDLVITCLATVPNPEIKAAIHKLREQFIAIGDDAEQSPWCAGVLLSPPRLRQAKES